MRRRMRRSTTMTITGHLLISYFHGQHLPISSWHLRWWGDGEGDVGPTLRPNPDHFHVTRLWQQKYYRFHRFGVRKISGIQIGELLSSNMLNTKSACRKFFGDGDKNSGEKSSIIMRLLFPAFDDALAFLRYERIIISGLTATESKLR